jgi:ornithine carbamoyltransferase
MIVTLPKFGINVNVATPAAYPFDSDIKQFAKEYKEVMFTNSPQEAVKDADMIVTDTWVSMGQESEVKARLENFKGWQITEESAKGAKPDWKFMHCLPRKPYEVDDQVNCNLR